MEELILKKIKENTMFWKLIVFHLGKLFKRQVRKYHKSLLSDFLKVLGKNEFKILKNILPGYAVSN